MMNLFDEIKLCSIELSNAIAKWLDKKADDVEGFKSNGKKKVHLEFIERCYNAVETLGRENNLSWHGGSDLESYIRISSMMALSNYWIDRPTALYGININYDDETLAPNILELRATDGSTVTLEIPEREGGGMVRKK